MSTRLNRHSAARGRRLTYTRRIIVSAMVGGLPAVLLALVLLWKGGYSPRLQWTLTGLILAFWLGAAWLLREKLAFPLQTLANLLEALREGDFSLRAKAARDQDALGEVLREANALSELLRQQRLDALEASALLRTVMAEIDVAVFAFDGAHRLKLVNRAGERLLGQAASRLLGQSADEVGLSECLQGEPSRTLPATFPGGEGRWGLRRSTFRQKGVPHHLLVLSDLSRPLREEERQAWQRLIRVLGHELNNSLAPIRSTAGTLATLLRRRPRLVDWEDDLAQGLAVIAGRSEALGRFMGAYSRLARLPQPQLRPVKIGECIRRVVSLETTLAVKVLPGPEMEIQADGDQLEQLLINLIRNAAEAALGTGGSVQVGWARSGSYLEVRIEDEGPGLSSSANLFVPFFTTKPSGSGIGLVLSRQIAEAHGGSLTLENRTGRQGCEARLRLPIGLAERVAGGHP
jgi:nitrogen fixation/metabolism regulation signal transduction histidine kinase